ncbi:MAG: outer membrane protein assembly factor BamD, partial [Candidatus Latescibacteria bacterium]|nr:outer membrane protein assembly factor BamD [Candidatus Latescibacterota bacterium]
MMMKKTCLFLLFVCLLCINTAYAQTAELAYSQEAETLFQRSLARYIRGAYEDTKLGLQELLEQHPSNQRTSAAQLLLGKAHYKLKDYSLAIASAVELQLNFPYSRYLAESDLLIGDCYFHQGQVYSAATQYGRVLTSRTEVRTKARAADRLGQMAGAERLSNRDIERLQGDFGRAIINEAISFAKEVKGKLVMKPSSGSQGSKGIKTVENTDDIVKWFDFVKERSETSTVVMEKYYEGREFSVDGMMIGSTPIIFSVSE